MPRLSGAPSSVWFSNRELLEARLGAVRPHLSLLMMQHMTRGHAIVERGGERGGKQKHERCKPTQGLAQAAQAVKRLKEHEGTLPEPRASCSLRYVSVYQMDML